MPELTCSKTLPIDATVGDLERDLRGVVGKLDALLTHVAGPQLQSDSSSDVKKASSGLRERLGDCCTTLREADRLIDRIAQETGTTFVEILDRVSPAGR